MRKRFLHLALLILILLIGMALGIAIRQDKTTESALEQTTAKSPLPFDDTLKLAWGKAFEQVAITSSVDKHVQKAYFYRSTASTPQPLVVSLHTWSGDYEQHDALATLCQQQDVNYIHPNFRGANTTEAACCSALALADIDDAISYALAHANVDTTKVFVIGVSGGGYATLSTFMKSKHTIHKFSAWASIADLVAWYDESILRENKYAANILACTGSSDTLDVQVARQRSPIYWPTPAHRLLYADLAIYAGVYDGIQGSVPITHSINFYNKLLTDRGVSDTSAYVTAHEKLKLLEFRKPLGDFGSIAGRRICLLKKFGNLKLVVFEGKHEMLTEFALHALLEEE